MRLRTYPLLWLSALALVGCMPPQDVPPAAAVPTLAERRIGALLSMTGPQANLGQTMVKAVQLALGTDGPQLDVHDTAGTPAGATAAAQAAVAANDAIIIGPLTAPETGAAAAAAPGVPILAFTSDQQQARPGLWTLGIEPEQQVERLVQALASHGRTRLVAVLPDNTFGTALAAGVSRAAYRLTDSPEIHRYITGRATSLDQAMREATGYDQRRGAIEARAKAARESGGDDAEQEAQAISAEPVPPPSFDSLLLAEGGPLLQQAATALPRLDVHQPEVQVVGPATWMRGADTVRGLIGAWYAAPDPVAREDFVRAYTARFQTPPAPYADLAYDAARAARTALAEPGALTRPQGFVGADGPYVLLQDGQVRRGLAVFTVGPNGAQIVEPAPSFAPLSAHAS